jgi:hypothetical protein
MRNRYEAIKTSAKKVADTNRQREINQSQHTEIIGYLAADIL